MTSARSKIPRGAAQSSQATEGKGASARRGRAARGAAQSNSGGFTLLEVMTALAIMAVSLTVLSQSQTNSARAIGRARQVTIATMLARYKMVEVEDELFKEGFSDFEEEDKDDFGDLEFKSFSYVVKVEKVELPTNIDAQAITDAVSGGGEEGGGGGDAAGGGMFAMGAKMMSAQFEMFRNVLEQSIRRVTVRVSWMEGKRERYVTVTTYFTDPRKIDNVAGGAGGLDSLVNQLTGGGTSGPGGTATTGGGTTTGAGGTATGGRGGISLPGAGGTRPITRRVPRR